MERIFSPQPLTGIQENHSQKCCSAVWRTAPALAALGVCVGGKRETGTGMPRVIASLLWQGWNRLEKPGGVAPPHLPQRGLWDHGTVNLETGTKPKRTLKTPVA